jgi:PAS domain S-box-containing protein
MSHVRMFKPWGWVVGTGIYTRDVEDEIAGIHRQLLRSVVPVLLLVGVVTGWLAWQSLISETRRNQANRALAESEERYRSLFEAAGDIILLMENEVIVDCNRKAEGVFGCSREMILGKTPFDFSPERQPDGSLTQAKGKTLLEQTRRDGQAQFDWRHIRQDGAVLDTEVMLVPVKLSGRDYFMAVVRDITERKRARDEMTRLVRAIEAAAEEIIITDVEGNIDYVNPAFERITGYSKEEARGKKPSILKSGEHDADFYAELWNTIKSGEVWRGRIVNRRKDGQQITEDATIAAIHGSQDHCLGYVSVKRDITEQIQLESQLRQAQKMEAIGQLAGGIAHDFNNILAAVIGYAEIILDDLGRQVTPETQSVMQILDAGKRAKDLVGQILTFSRQQEVEKRPVALCAIARESLKLLRASIPSTIEIHSELGCERDTVLADPTQLHQVVMNLCTNAWQAMREKGGTLEVGVRETVMDESSAARLQDLEPGNYLVLSVRDTGPGIPMALQGRIFEPFFTTKKRGEGTGLGLSVVHGIVKSHDGDIRLRSRPGQGALFEIYLPQVAPRTGVDDLTTKEVVARGNENVLIVDDEPTLTEVLKMLLETLGYHARSVNSPAEALKALKDDGAYVDLLLTDLTMPGMTGIELAREARRIRPGLPVILLTGYGERMLTDILPRNAISAIIRKPITRVELATRIRLVLDGQEPHQQA